jgi:hypothetical protein
MSAHQFLLNWLEGSPAYELNVGKSIPTQWMVAIFHVTGYRHAIAFGSSYEAACHKLIKLIS